MITKFSVKIIPNSPGNFVINYNMAALEKPIGDFGSKRRSNIIPFRNGRETLPQVLISLESFETVDPVSSYALFVNDSFIKNPELEVMDYASKATYKSIGTPSSSPQLEGDNPADIIATLDIEVFEKLRYEGLLLVDQFGGYYLMSAYNGTKIEDILNDLLNLKRAYLSQSRKAMSVNGLKAGVSDGSITNVESYLTSHHYDYSTRKHAFLDTIETITSGNFIEYRLNSLIPEES